MSIEARHLAGYGRYGDNNLVHVSDRELRGLETLTGRKFTKNPHTGLPEAFGFENFIPMIAGAVASIATGGAALPAALAAGAAGAGVSAAKGNDIGTSLTSGLISGIGSYAGAGLMSGAGEAANTAASGIADTAANAATTGAADALPALSGYSAAPLASTGAESTFNLGNSVSNATSAQGAAFPNAPIPIAGAMNTNPLDTLNFTNYQGMGVEAPSNAYGLLTSNPAATPEPASFSDTMTNRFTDAGRTATNIANNPGAALSKIGSNLATESGLKQAAMLGGSMYAQSQLPDGPPNKPAAARPWNYSPSLGKITPNPANMPGPGYQPGISPEWRYFSEGGPVHMADGGWASLFKDEYSPAAVEAPRAATPAMTPPPAGYRPGIDPQWNYFGGSQQNANPAPAATPAATAEGMVRQYVPAPADYKPGVDPQWNYFSYTQDPNAQSSTPSSTGPIAGYDESGGSSGGGDGDAGEGGAVGGSVRDGHLRHPPGSNPGAHKGLSSLSKSPHGTTSNIVNEAKAAMLGEHPNPKQALQRFRETFGDSALRALSESFAEGGRIRGAGGGLDDLVPGTIEGRQKVRLADGEFVVSSDVVSALGDGSTDQGVRKLQEMMNRVRREKTGKTKQPGPISNKALPA